MPLPPDTVQALVRIIELKDLTTAAHTWRVVLYTRALAEFFGMDHDRIARLSVGAALHDLGKIDVPDAILQKPGPLTPEEFAIIRTHPGKGRERLVAMGEDDPLVLELVRHHHERHDGMGYPDGLRGDATAAVARYFSVVDTFDALTSIRPYRHEVGQQAARAAVRELRDGIGSRYCAECVEAFAMLYERGDFDWILEHYNDRRELPAFAGMSGVEEAMKKKRK